jgi:hypothetical protein
MAGNREAEPETRLASVCRTIPLAVALEDVWQDIGRDSVSPCSRSTGRIIGWPLRAETLVI